MASRARKPVQQIHRPSQTVTRPSSTRQAPENTAEQQESALDTWDFTCCEVIIYRKQSGLPKTCIGRGKATLTQHEGYIDLTVSSFQPRCPQTRKLLPEQPLRWPVDSVFTSSVHQFSIFVHRGGKPCVWPAEYKVEGWTIASGLKQLQQRQDYRQQQRARFWALQPHSDEARERSDPTLFEVEFTTADHIERGTLAINTAGDVPAVSAVRLSIPTIPASGVDEDRPQVSRASVDQSTGSAGADAPAAQSAARPAEASMATSVVSLVSASGSQGSLASNSPPTPSPACTSAQGSEGQASSAQGRMEEAAKQGPAQHDGGVLEPPVSTNNSQAGTTPAVQPTQTNSAATQPQEPGAGPQQPADGQAQAPVQANPNAATAQGSRDKRPADAPPRNGKMGLGAGPGQTDASDSVSNRHGAGVQRPGNEPSQQQRTSTQQMDADAAAEAPAAPHHRHALSDFPGHTRNYAGSNTSLDSFASNHSSTQGHARGGQRWNNGQGGGGGGGHQSRDNRRDARGNKGSYGNLANAGGPGGGGMGGNKPYQGRNGTYASHHQSGRGGGMHHHNASGGVGRVSMDDLLLSQHAGHGAGHGRSGMPRVTDLAHGAGHGAGVSTGGASIDAQQQGQGFPEYALPEPAGTTDLERFMHQITPMIKLDCSGGRSVVEAMQALCLEDVWKFYEEPSLYGREVYTLGGARGPSLSYYVPYMSALQLFTPASAKEPGTQRLYVCDVDTWPKHMHMRFELFESELPFNRQPMYEQLEQMALRMERDTAAREKQQAAAAAAAAAVTQAADKDRQPSGAATPQSQSAPSTPKAAAAATAAAVTDSNNSTNASDAAAAAAAPAEHAAPSETANGPTSAPPASAPAAPQPARAWLKTCRLSELHQASWYCVAWYPVYRVPDAPLNTRFLTFHSFSPLIQSIQNAVAGAAVPPLSVLPLPLSGLRWNNMIGGERWLEPLTVDTQFGSVSNARRQDDDASSTYSSGGRGRRGQYGQQQRPQLDFEFQRFLSEMQSTAERLARGHNVRVLGSNGVEEYRQRHPDYEFFNSRG